jgi:signal transduction histidine kinase
MSTHSAADQKPARSSSGHLGEFAAMYVTIAAFSIATLIVQRDLWLNGRWISYVLLVALFAAITDRCARAENWSIIACSAAIGAQILLVLILTVVSDYYFLNTMLSFITVSTAHGNLPRRSAFVVDALFLIAIAGVWGWGQGWSAALQITFGMAAGFVFIIAFTQLAQRERQAREQLQRANAQLSEYSSRVERLATSRERNRLAREVHDSLGHYLTVINVQLEIVSKLMQSDPARAAEATAKAKELASEGLSEVRRSVAALRPSPLDDQPLPDALQNLIRDTRDAGLVVTFSQTGSVRPLGPEIETLVYRATQESLTNIRKHAHASTVEVSLAFESNAVRLRLRDNGFGRRNSIDSVGLIGLRERVAALNGSFRAENDPAGGFVVEVTLPLA